MRITSKGLVVAGALVVAVAAYICWLAITEITDSRYMTTLCGTTMSNIGIVQVSCSLVMAGMLFFAGIAMVVEAWLLRRQSRSNVESATESAA